MASQEKMRYLLFHRIRDTTGAASWGYTREEALKNLQEATECVIGSMIARGEDLPEGVKPSEEPLVAVSI
jgi:predicted RNase H-like HicB family nuclease